MIVGVLTTATSFSRCNPMWFLSMGLCQGSGLCSSSSRKYPGTEGTNQNRHWNNHRWHATNSLERTRLSCWCFQNHKVCTYRAPVRYETKTCRSIVLLNKKIHILGKRYVVKHNLITEVYLMTVMETTTCFGLYWPSSGCLRNLRASYMHARARGVEISTYA